jgi:flagellar biosynthesis/type III secretory pathway protein FliH
MVTMEQLEELAEQHPDTSRLLENFINFILTEPAADQMLTTSQKEYHAGHREGYEEGHEKGYRRGFTDARLKLPHQYETQKNEVHKNEVQKIKPKSE